MARYRAKAQLFLDRLIEVGEEFSSSIVPGRNWEPLDDDAKRAVAAQFPSGVVAPPAPGDTGRPLLAIPDDWRELSPHKIIQIARKLGAPATGTGLEVARTWIEREIANRGLVSKERTREAA